MSTATQAHTTMGGQVQRGERGAAGDGDAARRRNLRTALILLSIAAVFFAGIIVNRWLFGH